MKRVLILTFAVLGSAHSHGVPKVDPEIGPGTRISLTRDQTFGSRRYKYFCEGKEDVAWYQVRARRACCALNVVIPDRGLSEVVVRADVTRTVTAVDRGRMMFDDDSRLEISCTYHPVTGPWLERAFGDAIHVDAVVTPPGFFDGETIEL